MTDLERLARWSIRDWEGHAEYEDMLAEAYAAAWQGYQKGVERGARSALAYATRCASRAPIEWLRRWHGRSDSLRGRGEISFVPLEVLHSVGGGEFEDSLIDRLDRREIRQRLCGVRNVCKPEEWRLLCGVAIEGRTIIACARELGWSKARAHRAYDRVLQRARTLLEAPPKQARIPITHCLRGHEYTEANTYVHRGCKNCRICARRRNREWSQRKRWEQCRPLAGAQP